MVVLSFFTSSERNYYYIYGKNFCSVNCQGIVNYFQVTEFGGKENQISTIVLWNKVKKFDNSQVSAILRDRTLLILKTEAAKIGLPYHPHFL